MISRRDLLKHIPLLGILPFFRGRKPRKPLRAPYIGKPYSYSTETRLFTCNDKVTSVDIEYFDKNTWMKNRNLLQGDPTALKAICGWMVGTFRDTEGRILKRDIMSCSAWGDLQFKVDKRLYVNLKTVNRYHNDKAQTTIIYYK